jgi:signal transduction histidine kinase
LVRLREGFVSAVSHELRTPLQQMLLYGDLLRMRGLRSSGDQVRAAEVIVRETRRLIHLVENVLRFRPGGDRVGAARAEDGYPFDPLVATVVDEFRPLADSRRVVLDLDLGSGLVTDWHPDAVRRVLLNLLDNAVKYGPARGTVTVSTRAEDRSLLLAVDDEGSGVPDRETERVFDPYVRGSLHAGGDTGGTGIGLAIVRDLVLAAGGVVWLGRATSGGASVRVQVPVRARGMEDEG